MSARASSALKLGVEIAVPVAMVAAWQLWAQTADDQFFPPPSTILREFQDAQMVLYGATLVLCVQFLPGGLVSLVDMVWRAARRTSDASS